jgi:hypothetical protein
VAQVGTRRVPATAHVVRRGLSKPPKALSTFDVTSDVLVIGSG